MNPEKLSSRTRALDRPVNGSTHSLARTFPGTASGSSEKVSVAVLLGEWDQKSQLVASDATVTA